MKPPIVVHSRIKGSVLLALSALFSLSAVTARAVEIAAAAEVDHCKYLGEVRGFSGWGKMRTKTSQDKARQEALEKADSLGATHVVWDNSSGVFHQYANGKAYSCTQAQFAVNPGR